MQNIKPDIVYVCNPTSLHHEGLAWAQESGAHVFMEKPLTHQEQFLNSILQEWKNDRVFFIGFVLRYHPLIGILKEKLDQKLIGEVFSARFEFGSYLPEWHPGEKAWEGYAGIKSLGGGVINTVTHELDLMIYLFGYPQAVIAAKANHNYLNIDVEEIAEAIFSYPWGLASLHLDFIQRNYERSIKILGLNGRIILNFPENKIIIEKYNKPLETLEKKIEINQLYIDELKDFLELVRSNQTEHSLNFNYAIANTYWMLLMHKSAEKDVKWEKSLTNYSI